MRNIDETRNYFIEEIEQKKSMSKNHKIICTALNYIEHFLILAFVVTGYISVSVFGSLLGIPNCRNWEA